jgi:DNA-binding winged helix-turn-helix (wHTH) protein
MIQNTLRTGWENGPLDWYRDWVYALPPMRASRSAAFPVVVYRFGPYELDTGRIELRKFGLRVKLERKPLQLLIALGERAGEVVTRSELQRLLWGEDLFVDFDKGLNVAATKLRATLNDSPEKPSYIETVAGKGYRFVAEVEQVFVTAPASASVQPIAQVETPASLKRLPGALAFPPEREVQHPFYVGAVQPSSLQKRKTWRGIAVVVCVALFAVVIARLGWRRLRRQLMPERLCSWSCLLRISVGTPARSTSATA